MKIILKSAFCLLFLGMISTVNAQKKPFYNEQEQVIEAAYKSLDTELKSGDLITWVNENGIKGTYVFNITIGGKKGEVKTVSVVKGEGEIKHQNRLKDYVKEMTFPFKMPKDKSYKFQYEFKF